MNDQLKSMGMRSIISVWPRFERESRYFDMLSAKGWLLKDKDGHAVDGLPVRADRAGALIDSTNPEARTWFWGKIRDNIASQGFDWFWLDETEPDLVPDGSFYSIGSGDRYHNVFPLLHTEGVAKGSAQDRPNMRNLILSRAAYLGSQRTGGLFWSSDVRATWERTQAAGSRRAELYGLGSGLLGQRYRWLAVAQRPQGRASAAGRSGGRDGDGGGLCRLSRAVRALVRIQRVLAHAAHPRPAPRHRAVAIWQGRRADPGRQSAPALCADPLSLCAGPPDL
jgi:hypothetical protein